KSDYDLFLETRHAIKAGVDVVALDLREDLSFDPRENDVEIEPLVFRGRRVGGQASVYVQDQVRLLPRLTANLGVRYDAYSVTAHGGGLSPRVNVAYAFDGGHTVLHA